ncbi:hypothetical protein T492DRAFT_981933, partial [Pavlovales sp. CCMP2436]
MEVEDDEMPPESELVLALDKEVDDEDEGELALPAARTPEFRKGIRPSARPGLLFCGTHHLPQLHRATSADSGSAEGLVAEKEDVPSSLSLEADASPGHGGRAGRFGTKLGLNDGGSNYLAKSHLGYDSGSSLRRDEPGSASESGRPHASDDRPRGADESGDFEFGTEAAESVVCGYGSESERSRECGFGYAGTRRGRPEGEAAGYASEGGYAGSGYAGRGDAGDSVGFGSDGRYSRTGGLGSDGGDAGGYTGGYTGGGDAPDPALGLKQVAAATIGSPAANGGGAFGGGGNGSRRGFATREYGRLGFESGESPRPQPDAGSPGQEAGILSPRDRVQSRRGKLGWEGGQPGSPEFSTLQPGERSGSCGQGGRESGRSSGSPEFSTPQPGEQSGGEQQLCSPPEFSTPPTGRYGHSGREKSDRQSPRSGSYGHFGIPRFELPERGSFGSPGATQSARQLQPLTPEAERQPGGPGQSGGGEGPGGESGGSGQSGRRPGLRSRPQSRSQSGRESGREQQSESQPGRESGGKSGRESGREYGMEQGGRVRGLEQAASPRPGLLSRTAALPVASASPISPVAPAPLPPFTSPTSASVPGPGHPRGRERETLGEGGREGRERNTLGERKRPLREREGDEKGSREGERGLRPGRLSPGAFAKTPGQEAPTAQPLSEEGSWREGGWAGEREMERKGGREEEPPPAISFWELLAFDMYQLRVELCDRLDLALLVQALAHGALDAHALADLVAYVLDKLKTLQAPSRDAAAQAWADQILPRIRNCDAPPPAPTLLKPGQAREGARGVVRGVARGGVREVRGVQNGRGREREGVRGDGREVKSRRHIEDTASAVSNAPSNATTSSEAAPAPHPPTPPPTTAATATSPASNTATASNTPAAAAAATAAAAAKPAAAAAAAAATSGDSNGGSAVAAAVAVAAPVATATRAATRAAAASGNSGNADNHGNPGNAVNSGNSNEGSAQSAAKSGNDNGNGLFFLERLFFGIRDMFDEALKSGETSLRLTRRYAREAVLRELAMAASNLSPPSPAPGISRNAPGLPLDPRLSLAPGLSAGSPGLTPGFPLAPGLSSALSGLLSDSPGNQSGEFESPGATRSPGGSPGLQQLSPGLSAHLHRPRLPNGSGLAAAAALSAARTSPSSPSSPSIPISSSRPSLASSSSSSFRSTSSFSSFSSLPPRCTSIPIPTTSTTTTTIPPSTTTTTISTTATAAATASSSAITSTVLPPALPHVDLLALSAGRAPAYEALLQVCVRVRVCACVCVCVCA